MICTCGKKMSQIGGNFKNSPYQNFMCFCGKHNFNGQFFTKKEWSEWIESAIEDNKNYNKNKGNNGPE